MKEEVFAQVKADLAENEGYLRNHEPRFRLTAQAVLQSNALKGPNPRLLDIGCWPGYLSLYFRRTGWEVDAIDLKPERIPIVSEAGIKIIDHNLNETPSLPYPKDHFDVILFTEVFEHLNPVSFGELFAGIENCLKPGGRLILTTPNRLALNKNLFIPSRWDEPEVDEEGHGHWKEYRLQEVIDCFAQTNLEVTRQETISFYSQLGRSNETGYFPLKEWKAHPNKVRNIGKILINPIRNLPLFRDSLLVVAEKRNIS
jgi:2-polyprenyl-3-methyl-5-hydroxy-6-metoxy-1,4-benzoquinol methylase